MQRCEVAAHLAEGRHIAPRRIHFNRKPLQVFSEFTRKDPVTVRDMVPRESRRADKGTGDFTHAGEAAVVEVLRIAVRAVRRMLCHLVVKRALFGELIEAFTCAVHDAAERPLIVIQEAVDHRAVEFRGVIKVARNFVVEHRADAVTVRKTDSFLLGFFNLVRPEVRLHDDSDRDHHQKDRNHFAALKHQGRGDRRGNERGESGDKPAGNHGDHTGHAVHSRFTVPGTIRKRRPHRHHEGHVSGRKRKLEGRRGRDQNRGHDEVKRRADIVKREHILTLLYRLRFEAAREELEERLRED